MKKLRMLVVLAILMSFAVLSEAAPNYADPVTFTGRLQRDGNDFYISGVEMELGDRYTVGGDYNKDGQLTVIERELWMMTNQQVTIQGYRDTKAKKNIIYVTAINGMAYPNTKVDHSIARPIPDPANPEGKLQLKKPNSTRTSDN